METNTNESSIGLEFVYSLHTQSPPHWFTRLLSTIVGFWLVVYVLWKTGAFTAAFRRIYTLVFSITSRIVRYLFDRYFDLRRFGEWMLMCICPQVYAIWKACMYGYTCLIGIRRTFAYFWNWISTIFGIFGIRPVSPVSSPNRRQLSVESLRRAPLSRETSRVSSR